MESAARRPGRPEDPALKARRQAEILSAAAAAFARHGFAGTDVQVIADAAGVGKGTVYRYFPTKEALFLAAVDHGLQELTAKMDVITEDPTLDPVDVLRVAVREYLAFFHRRPELAELFIQERAEFGGRHTPRYFAMKQAEDDCEGRAFVERLVADGRFRAVDPARFLTVVGDLLYGTVLSNHLSGRPASPAAQAAAIVDIILHGVLSDAERRRAARKRTAEGKA
jgi:AcrR family transcriptional regulator